MQSMLTKLFSLLLLVFTTGANAGHVDEIRDTLENGLRVVIARDSLAPVVTVEVNYLVGARESPMNFPGTAHALEHMMFRGSPGLSGDQLAATMVGLGGGFNALTTQDITQFYASAPVEDLAVLLHVEALRMRGADLREDDWRKERGAIEQEVARDLSDPGIVVNAQIAKHIFKGTPYAHSPLGSRVSFEKTDAGMLRQFHDAWYAPNNAVVVIAGDVDARKALQMVRDEFGSIPRKKLPHRPAFAFAPVKDETLHFNADSPVGFACLAYRLPGNRSPDYATVQVLAGVLGSPRGPFSPMAMDGTTLVSGFVGRVWAEAGIGMALSAYPRDQDAGPILGRMRGVLAGVANTGVDAALVESVKRKLIGDLAFKENSVSGLANVWSYAVAVQGAGSPDEIRRALEAVTPAKVNDLVRRIFTPESTVTAVLNPTSSVKPIVKSDVDAPENFSAEPDHSVKLPDWAERAFDKLKEPSSTLAPRAYTLPNGLRLIVQPEAVSDTVELIGDIRSNPDIQEPRGQEGVSRVLGDLFQFGTERLDRVQLQEAFDEIGARERAGGHFSLSVPVARFSDGLRLLAENELHPALLEKDFKLVRRQEASGTAGVVLSPSFIGTLELNKRLLPAGDPYLRYATPESIEMLSLADVKAYYAKAFRPDLTTIVIVGKVDPELVRVEVERNFGTWQTQSSRPELDYPAVPPNRASYVHIPDSQARQSGVAMTQWISVDKNDPTRFALILGDQVLSGGYASRLFRDLRSEHGLVYSVGANFDFGKRRSFYTVSFGAAPDKVKEARGRVLADLKRLQSEPISDDELRRAKGVLLRGIPLSESSFGDIASKLLSYSEQGMPLDESEIAGRRYISLTAQDVRDAYAKHIRLDGFVTEVTGPDSK